MELVGLFKIIVLKIDLRNAKLISVAEHENLRQELGVNINTSLSGPRVGQWIGGRTKNNKIYLIFRVSDPEKAKKYIMRLLGRCDKLSNAKIRIKEKKLLWDNYSFI